MQPIIRVENLQKSYGNLQAVRNVSFEVQANEIFGMVGPNGAGKTTTIEIIEGLRQADSGSIKVLGMDPTLSRKQLTERIGIQLQSASLPPRLRVAEACELFGALYLHRANFHELLERMGLSEKRNTPIGKLSGGQKQRLFIALALLNQPELVFFDELTTGLDPQARRSMWELVQQIRQEGSTVFLTTHFMEEAERLCDRVLILDQGTTVALDTPEALVASLGVEKRIVFSLAEGQQLPSLENRLSVNRVEQIGQRVIIYGMGNRFTSSVVSLLEDENLDILDLRTEQPNLDDVFISLTGREMRE
jgi:ABC-2 type transport system ATP-binding protein